MNNPRRTFARDAMCACGIPTEFQSFHAGPAHTPYVTKPMPGRRALAFAKMVRANKRLGTAVISCAMKNWMDPMRFTVRFGPAVNRSVPLDGSGEVDLGMNWP